MSPEESLFASGIDNEINFLFQYLSLMTQAIYEFGGTGAFHDLCRIYSNRFVDPVALIRLSSWARYSLIAVNAVLLMT